jgi:hypothetical protein
MSNMPNWLAKTPEMIAMDRWFSLVDAGSEAALAERYLAAINRVTAPGQTVFEQDADSLDAQLAGGAAAKTESFQHFGQHWLNLFNLDSGGDYWPQIPTWTILIILRQAIFSGCKKALGSNYLSGQAEYDDVYAAELDDDPSDPRDTVLPLCTTWICVASSGTTFDADVVRGPSAVELVISTPVPYRQSRIYPKLKPQFDQMWKSVHDTPFPPPPVDPFAAPESGT